MRLIIAGTRTFDDYKLLERYANLIVGSDPDVTVLSGGAAGADKLGERWAEENGHNLEIYLPDWETQGKAAGPRRNARMADNADELLAFWDGKSKGTRNMLAQAHLAGLLITEVRYAEEL